MAITALHYRLYTELHEAGLLPQGGPILEIGEANWYGDVDPRAFCDPPADGNLFTIAKQFYKAMFGTAATRAIDLNGTDTALRFDLNERCYIDSVHSVVINNGTSEHVFDIANVFRIMHDACAVGGLMIHDAPFTGWIDHGFYNLNPTLFWDLAKANNYYIVRMVYGTLDGKLFMPIDRREDISKRAHGRGFPDGCLLLTVFEKMTDAPFRIPVQGIYANTLSDEAKMAWQTMR